MKRYLAIFLIVTTLFCILPVSAAETAPKPIEVFYLGEKLEFPVPPQLIGGSTMVPMRAIFEALGYVIEWDAETKTVAAYLDHDVIGLTIGEKEAYINGTPQPLAAPAALVNGSTLVPLRFIGEASGYLVDWHDAERSVTIEYPVQLQTDLAEKRKGMVEELKRIKRDLPALHANLFLIKSRAEFNAEMDALINNEANLSDSEIKFELIRIVNTVNDTHTAARLNKESAFDVYFFEFQEGIYLIDATLKYADFIGKRLTGINGFTIDQLYEKLSPIIPFDNESIEKYMFTSFLSQPDYLKLAGIISSTTNVPFQFENETLTISSQGSAGSPYSKSNASSYVCPLSYRNPSVFYWFTALPEKNAVYVKFNKCTDQNSTFAQFTNDVFAELRGAKADTLIIDLRDNPGGDNRMFLPFMKAIKNNPQINKSGHLYVITGRKSFSAAVLISVSLRKETYATFVGEETGGNENLFANGKVLSLPYLQMSIAYGKAFTTTGKFEEHTFKPNILITPKASSFFSGKDDFLEAVYANMAKH